MAPRSFRPLDLLNWSTRILLATFLLATFLAAAASASQQASIVFGTGGPGAPSAKQPAGCPNQGGIITAISVPAGQPLALAILLGAPAPPGGVTFQLASLDPTIAAAGDPTQALLPIAFIPAGQTLSNTFLLYGVVVGPTYLEALSLTQGFGSFFTPVSVWDVNPGAGLQKFLDANPPNLSTCRDPNSPNLSTDKNILSTCGTPVQGGVADGATQLLMRLVAGLPGTACYEITSTGTADQGTIPTQVTLTQSVGNLEYGFSFYQVPNNYGDTTDSRQVQVQFFYTPTQGFANTSSITASLTIIRPPLVLIHGLWGDPTSWPSIWDRSGSSYTTKKADYSSTNASHFSTNYPQVQDFVETALQASRDKGFAATRADVTAHSMGGLLTRLYAGSVNFARPDNFNLGDVHRLVTLDTPHFGSNLANLLVSLDANSQAFRNLASVAAAFRAVGFGSFTIYQGAVCDLAENSPALQGLSGGTNLTSEVISATGGPPGAPNGGNYYLPIEILLDLPSCIPGFSPGCIVPPPLFPQSVVNGFRFRENNDAIVPLSSQQGGLLGANYPSQIHTNITKFNGVTTQVFPLLDQPDSSFDPSLPAVPSNGLGTPKTVPGRGSPLDQQDYSFECGAGGPMALPQIPGGQPQQKRALPAQTSTPDPRVQVTSPANGQVYAPGNTVNVTVQITSPLLANAGFLAVPAPGLGVITGTNYNGSTYQASFVIPSNYAGPLTLTPDIVDSNSNPIEGVGITISVSPTTAPLSLTLVEGTFNHLLSATATARVYVTGNYANGLQLDLTSSVTGTTYTSSNNQVLTVDTEGNVQAKAFGTAVVVVQNGGLKVFASFDVEDPANPLPPQDLTSGLTITRSGYRVDRTTGYFVQTVQITNGQTVPVIGPMYFAVTGLPGGVTLANSGSTKNIPPVGSPYVTLSTPDGITLQPGASLNLTLQFLDPSRARINYTPKVFRTLTAP